MKVNEPPVIVEQDFRRPKTEVWNALTNPETMRQWFFENIPDFKAKLGFSTAFEVHVEGKVFTHLWKIVEVVQNERLVLNWKYKEYAGDSFVTFDLSDTSEGSKIVLSTKVVEDFPDDIPEFTRDSCLGGWTYFLKSSLVSYLK